MKKKGLLCIVLAIMMVAMLTTTALAAPDGWAKNSKSQWTYTLKNKKVTGWKQINGKWYLFNSKGIMLTGWQKDSKGVWYYLFPGGDMVTGWMRIEATWYYLQSSGAMKTGWYNVDGTWYYLDPKSGAMKTGWLQVGGKWYFLTSTGAMKTGWHEEKGKAYYLDPVSGAMKTGKATINGGTYEFNKDGALLSSPTLEKWNDIAFIVPNGWKVEIDDANLTISRDDAYTINIAILSAEGLSQQDAQELMAEVLSNSSGYDLKKTTRRVGGLNVILYEEKQDFDYEEGTEVITLRICAFIHKDNLYMAGSAGLTADDTPELRKYLDNFLNSIVLN